MSEELFGSLYFTQVGIPNPMLAGGPGWYRYEESEGAKWLSCLRTAPQALNAEYFEEAETGKRIYVRYVSRSDAPDLLEPRTWYRVIE